MSKNNGGYLKYAFYFYFILAILSLLSFFFINLDYLIKLCDFFSIYGKCHARFIVKIHFIKYFLAILFLLSSIFAYIFYIKKAKNTMEFINSKINLFIIKFNGIGTKKIIMGLFFFNIILRGILQFFSSIKGVSADGAQYLSLAHQLYGGGGYVSNSLFNLFLDTGRIPFEEMTKPLLLPYIISFSYKIFGESFFAAKLPIMVIGSLIGIVTFLLLHEITKSKNISVLLSILVSVNPILLSESYKITTEVILTLLLMLTILTLYKGLNKKSMGYMSLSGVFFGLSYLQHVRASLIFLPIMLQIFLKNKDPSIKEKILRSVKFILPFMLSALLIISPLLLRNYMLAGNPLFTATKYFLLQNYGKNLFLGPVDPYSIHPPPDIIPYIMSHKMQFLSHFVYGLKEAMIHTPFEVVGSFIIFFMALAGMIIGIKRWRDYVLFYLYLLSTYIFFSVTDSSTRFFYNLAPIYLIFTGVYLKYQLDNIKKSNSKNIHISNIKKEMYLVLGCYAAIIILLFFSLFGLRLQLAAYISYFFFFMFILLLFLLLKNVCSKMNGKINNFNLFLLNNGFVIFLVIFFANIIVGTVMSVSLQNDKVDQVLSVSDFIFDNNLKDKMIMVDPSTYYFEYFYSTKSLSVSKDNENEFQQLLSKYNVSYIIIPQVRLGELRPDWSENGPYGNIKLVYNNSDKEHKAIAMLIYNVTNMLHNPQNK